MLPGERIKKVREILGLTQEAFGERLGFKQAKIKDIETGKQKVTPEIALDIERKFHYSFRWLLTGEGDMKVVFSYNPNSGSILTTAEGTPNFSMLSDLEEMLLRIINEGDQTKETAVRALLAALDPRKNKAG
jgi:transcriptional regulator with XRE-family HTH domain